MEVLFKVAWVLTCVLGFVAALEHLSCRHCSGHVHSLEDCPMSTCESNEMCYVSDSISILMRTEHVARCMDMHMCRKLTRMILEYMEASSSSDVLGRRRKRNIHSCDICCGDDDCNSKTCHQLKHEMFAMYEANKLNLTTLSMETHDDDRTDVGDA